MNNRVKQLVMTGLFAAIICVTTLFLHIVIPFSQQGGYIHIGDTFIYIAASVLPLPFAMLAGAIGAGLADLISAPLYLIPTIIIKSLMAACFTNCGQKMLCKRNVIATILAGLICIVGYYIAEVIMSGNWVAPLAAVPLGLIQPVASGILYVLAAKMIGSKRILGV